MTIYVNNLLSAAAADVTGKPTPTRAWQWLRNGTAISGANSSTYTVVEADLAASLSVSQIETNLGGIDTATSTALGPVSIFGVNSLFANAYPTLRPAAPHALLKLLTTTKFSHS